jgi:hypothetical protein
MIELLYIAIFIRAITKHHANNPNAIITHTILSIVPEVLVSIYENKIPKIEIHPSNIMAQFTK